MNEVVQTVGKRLNIRVDEIRAQALKLQPMDGRPFNPPVLDRAEVRKELVAAAEKSGFKDLTAPLSRAELLPFDLAADGAEELLYKRSFGDDALPGQRMMSQNPWETALCGPARTTDGRNLGEVLFERWGKKG
jgi:hypothetical protein